MWTQTLFKKTKKFTSPDKVFKLTDAANTVKDCAQRGFLAWVKFSSLECSLMSKQNKNKLITIAIFYDPDHI